MSIDPKFWGKHGWIFLHSVALAYPNEPTIDEKRDMKIFFLSMGRTLPCMECRGNFSQHLKKFPLNDKALESRYSLVTWLHNIHAEVTKMVSKKKGACRSGKCSTRQEYKVTHSNIGRVGNIMIITAILIIFIYIWLIRTN